METRKLLLGSLFIGAILAVVCLLFPTPASAKPVTDSTSQEVIDASINEQMHQFVSALG